MRQIPAWAKPLDIDENTCKNWIHQAPLSWSFTFWCLRNKKISSTRYLQWAQKEHSLICLNRKKEWKIDKKFHNLVSGIYPWSMELIPLTQWDGTIFVACVEPLKGSMSFPVQSILAHPTQLKALWKQWTEAIPQPKVQVKPLAEESFKQNSRDENSLSKESGINLFNPDEESFSKTTTNFLLVNHPEEEQEQEEEQEAISSINVAPVKLVENQDSDEEFTSIATLSLDSTKKLNLKDAITHVKSKYKYGFILKKDANGLILYICDPGLNPKEPQLLIDTKQHSAFSFVLSTPHPFHGPMKENDIHESFLDNLGLKFPKHVTMVKADDYVIIGLSDGLSNLKSNLHYTEKIAKKVAS